MALYLLDWDTTSRNEIVTVQDVQTGATLDTRTVTNFNGGQYLVWNITGHVNIWISNNGATNAVMSGIFFAPPSTTLAWQDSFNTGQLDSSRWAIANGQAPGYIANQHIGYYEPANVTLNDGLLKIALQQTTGTVDTNSNGVISYGGMVYSNSTYGYGTYEWTMRMSSEATCSTCTGPVDSGSVSAGFVYTNNSQTEIDFEFSALTPQSLWLVNWLNPNPKQDPTGANETYTELSPFDSTSGFHTYKFIWSAAKISYYIDGVWMADHITNVPSAPAYFMINHWGTDSNNWGGMATLGPTRYMYVSHASYSPST